MRYYIADTHFWHSALNEHMDQRGFESVEAMNDYMIKQWNSRVREKDEVVILGDFSFGNVAQTKEIIDQLKGRFYLIKGNHDKVFDQSSMDISRFVWIKDYAEIKDNKRRVVLCHYPIMFYKGQYHVHDSGIPNTYMLHGHIHDTRDTRLLEQFIKITRDTSFVDMQGKIKQLPCHLINCFCKYSDYVPLTLDEWIALTTKREELLQEMKHI